MKIHVRNLGPLHKPVEFDLKPLTLFIGPNNSGKTWLAYTLAGIFDAHGGIEHVREELLDQAITAYPLLARTVDEILATGTASLDFVQFAEEYGEKYFNDVARRAQEWLPDYLSTHLALFDDLELSIHFEKSPARFLERILASSFRIDIGISEQRVLLSISKERSKKKISLYTYSKEQPDETLPPREDIIFRLADTIFHRFHQALYPNVAILPTERTTFITFPFNVEKERKLAKESSATEDEDVRDTAQSGRILSFPVSNYMSAAIAAYEIGSKEEKRRKDASKRQPEIGTYMDLARKLQQEILGGQVDFSTPEPDLARELVFRPATSTSRLEISLASSMVKELAPLAIYLRYFARPGDLLIIDEPEMNLHPKAQVQMIEFLAMLVNAGLHILVTTHSPYALDHLTNLLEAAKHEDKESICSEFFLKDSSAFINREKVAVYRIENGEVRDVLNNEEEEDLDTFAAISDRISDIYFKL